MWPRLPALSHGQASPGQTPSLLPASAPPAHPSLPRPGRGQGRDHQDGSLHPPSHRCTREFRVRKVTGVKAWLGCGDTHSLCHPALATLCRGWGVPPHPPYGLQPLRSQLNPPPLGKGISAPPCPELGGWGGGGESPDPRVLLHTLPTSRAGGVGVREVGAPQSCNCCSGTGAAAGRGMGWCGVQGVPGGCRGAAVCWGSEGCQEGAAGTS